VQTIYSSISSSLLRSTAGQSYSAYRAPPFPVVGIVGVEKEREEEKWRRAYVFFPHDDGLERLLADVNGELSWRTSQER
jgi:hypothetical protein